MTTTSKQPLIPILAVKAQRKPGRPKVKARVRHLTLFLDADLLEAFDALCQHNGERSRTAAIEALMGLYLREGNKPTKDKVMAAVAEALDKIL